jgi:magnesium chelatase family protein
MLSRVFSCAVIGLEGVVVEVEVNTTNGVPGMDILGSNDLKV